MAEVSHIVKVKLMLKKPFPVSIIFHFLSLCMRVGIGKECFGK